MKEQFQNLLKRKDEFWRCIFCALYLQKNPNVMMLVTAEKVIDQADCNEIIKLCYETEIVYPKMLPVYKDVKKLYETRSPLWRYKFIDTVAKLIIVKLLPATDIQSLFLAYLYALKATSFKVTTLVESIDQKYQQLRNNISHKADLLFRNMTLAFEIDTGKELYYQIPQQCNFSELLEFYAPICGTDKFCKIADKAYTADVKLTADELNALSLTYISPYGDVNNNAPFLEKIGVKLGYDSSSTANSENKISKDFPQSSLFAYVERRMKFLLNVEKQQRKILHDDDENNEQLRDLLQDSPMSNTVFLDFNKSVIISTQWSVNEYFYAVIYIQKQPHSEIFASNFINIHNGLIYVVKFVEDLHNCCESAKILFDNINKLEQTLTQYINMYEKKSVEVDSKIFHRKILEYLSQFAINDEFFS